MIEKMEGDVERLSALFKPRSVVLVGATERSLWSNAAFGNLEKFDFSGEIHLVNRKGGSVYGRNALTSISQIERQVDLALLMVPEAALEATLDELAGKVRSAIILTSGFAETGEEGRRRQAAIADRARAGGVTLMGPNSLGFINFADNIPVWTNFRRRQRSAGAVAFVSQSGAIANTVADFGYRQQVPFSYLVSTGNEADICLADVMEYLADDPSTRTIAMFVETVRDGQRFAAAADRVRQAGKPIVLLKIGAGEVSAKAAQAHTGALVGNDRVFDAACRRLGIVRVSSLEDLLFTADLLARLGPIAGRGVGFSSISGGLCEIAADRFEAEGIPLQEIGEETRATLRTALPNFGTPHNPLDLTGGALLDVSLFEKGLGLLGQDPSFDLVACLYDGPETEKDHPLIQQAFEAIGRGLAASGKPSVVFTSLASSVTSVGRKAEQKANVIYSGAGLDRGVTAIAHSVRWWEGHRARAKATSPNPLSAPSASKPRLEREVLDYLSSCGVPVIPAHLVNSVEAANEAGRAINGPLALKIVSPQISHKSDVGGVALRVAPEDAGREYAAMIARVGAARPDAALEGVIVSPMRGQGVELFVGSVRDPVWGPAITVGFGGILVELLKDTALRLLPVSVEDVTEMLGELRGKALLAGFRGAPAVDVPAVAAAVKSIGDAVMALGSDLVSLEVNPLLAIGSRVEALDGLTVWED